MAFQILNLEEALAFLAVCFDLPTKYLDWSWQHQLAH
ncbi:unnamed protein product, partial [Amoebophrya sp. A25]|eukprot:GSA25T00011516001.1